MGLLVLGEELQTPTDDLHRPALESKSVPGSQVPSATFRPFLHCRYALHSSTGTVPVCPAQAELELAAGACCHVGFGDGFGVALGVGMAVGGLVVGEALVG